jgi:hypothetical protein
MSNPIKEIFNLIEKEKELNKLALDNLEEQKTLKVLINSKVNNVDIKFFSICLVLNLFLICISYIFLSKPFTGIFLIIFIVLLFCFGLSFLDYSKKYISYKKELSNLKKDRFDNINNYIDVKNKFKALNQKYDKIKSELGLVQKDTIKLVDSIDSETILNYISKNEINNQEYIVLDNILNSKIYMAKEKNSNKKNLLKNKINKLNSIENEILHITNE